MIKKIVFRFTIFFVCFSYSPKFNASFASENSETASLARIEQEIASKNLTKASLTDLVAIVNKYPTNSRAHIILGGCCDSMGLPEQAMVQYKLAFKYSPNNIDSLLELIKAQIRAGQVSAARNLLKQAMERFPSDPRILFWTGNTLFKERHYEEAKQLYMQAINRSKKPIVGINSALGNLNLLEKRYYDALSLSLIDLSDDPDLPQANAVAGLALSRMGRLEQAYPYLAIAYKNDPTNHNLAFDYALSLIWCGKYSDALVPALSGLASSTNFTDRMQVTKIIDKITPDLSKATILEAIKQVNRSPHLNKNVFVHLEIAKICLRKNLSEPALNEYLMVVTLDPNSAYAKYKLALVIENYKHDYPAALNYLRAAKALDPYNSEINQHLMRLEDRLTINKSDWAWRMKDWLSVATNVQMYKSA